MPAHYSYSFLDINPLARGHALVIPKCSLTTRFHGILTLTLILISFAWLVVDHAEKLHELPDEYLADVLPLAKKIAVAQGVENYNILQVGAVFLTCPPRRRIFCSWSNDLRSFLVVE